MQNTEHRKYLPADDVVRGKTPPPGVDDESVRASLEAAAASAAVTAGGSHCVSSDECVNRLSVSAGGLGARVNQAQSPCRLAVTFSLSIWFFDDNLFAICYVRT